MSSTKFIYYNWYSIRDEFLVNLIKRHIETNNRTILPLSQSILKSGCDIPIRFLFLTGNPGSGKTYVQIHLTNFKNICFLTPTNVSGQILANTLDKHAFFGKSSFKVYKTIYKHFSERPEDTQEYDNILYSGVSQNAKNGIFTSLSELFHCFGKSMYTICQKRFSNLCRKNNYISPVQYAEAKAAALASGFMTQGGDFLNENDAIVQYMQATGFAFSSNIPDPLKYNKYVIDEAGRVSAMTGFLLIYYHFYIHVLYDTDARDIIPALILVGSGVQCRVINKTPYAINDYSLITMIGAPFFSQVKDYMSKDQKFGRRCVNGCISSMSAISDLLEKLLLGQPISLDVRTRFLDCFEVTDTEFVNPKVTDCVHIAKKHQVLTDIQTNLFKHHVKKDVVEYFITPTNRDDVPDYVYAPHENLGACYRSVIYNNKKWVKTDKREKIMFDDLRTGWKYKNSRPLLINTPYKMTHSSTCTLIAVDGSLEDFIADLEMFKENMCSSPDRMKQLIIILMQYLNSASEMMRHYSESLYENYKRISSVISVLESALGHEDSCQEKNSCKEKNSCQEKKSCQEKNSFLKKQKQMTKLQGIKLEINTLIDKYISLTTSGENSPVPANLIVDFKGYLLLQGNTFILRRIDDNYLICQLGKTLHFKLYRKTLPLKGRSVFDFSNIPGHFAGKRSADGKLKTTKKKENKPLDLDDLLFEEETLNETMQDVEDINIVVKDEHDHITFCFFPVKSFIVETIDSTQGNSFDFKHIVLLTKSMSAEDFIVGCSRTVDTKFLKVFCEYGRKNWSLKSLHPIIAKSVRIINKQQQKIGWL